MRVATASPEPRKMHTVVEQQSPEVRFFGIIIATVISAFAFQYALWSVFQQDVPWYIDALAGYVFMKYMARIAIVCLIIRYCGLSLPLWASIKEAIGY